MRREQFFRGISETWARFKQTPRVFAETQTEVSGLVKNEERQSIFDLVVETLNRKVLSVSVTVNGLTLGIFYRPEGRLAFMEYVDDDLSRILIRTDGQSLERLKFGRYSEEPEVSQTVTEKEIRKLTEWAKTGRRPKRLEEKSPKA